MPGPTLPRLFVSAALGIALLALLIQGLNMFAAAAVRQAEIDDSRAKFVVVGDR